MIATPEICNANLVNADAEHSVLGAMLMDRDAIAEAHEIVKPEHFFSQPCRMLYEALPRTWQSKVRRLIRNPSAN